MSIETLRFGAPEDAIHVCVDMQNLFSEGTEWASPVVQAIAPKVAHICEIGAQRTIFTRFMTPHEASQAPGQWQIYYRRWDSVLAKHHDPSVFDILPNLRRFVPPARIIDKYAHSAFEAPAFVETLSELDARTLILTGVETDVCVLATALGAIDRGLRTILVSDAIASSAPASHEAAMTGIYPRFDMQVEMVDTATILSEWRP